MTTFKLSSPVKFLPVLAVLVILLALSACSSASITTSTSTSTSTPPTSTSTSTSSSQSVTIDLTAQNMAFNKQTITVPAGAKVTINFTNKDNIPHNFAAYTDSTAATTIFKGTVITNSNTTYTFTAPATPGTYFFRCDVHPTSMTGSFIVQ
jgi:plastocyanin